MPMNKETVKICIEVVIIVLMFVYINNQNKNLKTELNVLKIEFEEFKEQTIQYIQNIYTQMGFNVSRKGDEKKGKKRGDRDKSKNKHIENEPKIEEITKEEEKEEKRGESEVIEDTDEETKLLNTEFEKQNELGTTPITPMTKEELKKFRDEEFIKNQSKKIKEKEKETEKKHNTNE